MTRCSRWAGRKLQPSTRSGSCSRGRGGSQSAGRPSVEETPFFPATPLRSRLVRVFASFELERCGNLSQLLWPPQNIRCLGPLFLPQRQSGCKPFPPPLTFAKVCGVTQPDTTGLRVTVGDVTRELPTVRVGSLGRVPLVEFIGDSELTNAAAEAMLPLIPEDTEVLLTVVTNALPLTHELSDRSGIPYVVVRKKRRTYMQDPLIQDVPSLTLGVAETLWLDGRHAARLKGKRVTIVQDVVATGGTAQALARLVERAGGQVAGYLAAFKQGNTTLPLTYLQELPQSL
ncbi:phosphoribosyltransferase [Deinococcus geothermalis DSM 11300]|uniref:Phosphoribosyltransferase n=1 Tax=Deinococcus geothermalis (strain DSM 11300 / CIP 105573 / AG-3a) TaxID=319795 RepID=Q1J035_DEIGD|nr:phosphoribosyltransferase [Deinococcus geothermalis DSM 11300]